MTLSRALIDQAIRRQNLSSVAIQSDEYYTSYAGRVANVNGVPSLGVLYRSVTGEAPRRYWADFVQFLAGYADMDVEQFIRLHSAFPLNAAFSVGAWSRKVADGKIDPLAIRQLATMAPRLKYCVGCAMEDVEFWGCSYWRVTHQLHGIECCLKHRRRLIVTDWAADIQCSVCPVELMYSDMPTLDRLLFHQSRLQARYGDVLLGFMDLQGRTKRDDLVSLLNERASLFGVACAANQAGNPLTGMIHETEDQKWVRRLIGGLKAICGSDVDYVFRRVFTKAARLPLEVYALVLAILYRESDEALTDLLENSHLVAQGE